MSAPIIPWVGGKRRLADRLLPLFLRTSVMAKCSAAERPCSSCALAQTVRSMKGKAMVSINDHPQIRELFDDLTIHTLDIKYSLGNKHGDPEASGELVITNWAAEEGGGLF